MLKSNLILKKSNVINGFIFEKDESWKNSILITHANSLLLAPLLDVFFILKSYVDNEAALVEHAFFVLEGGAAFERRVLQTIFLYELKNMNNFLDFCNWWERVASKIWVYENLERRVAVLFILNTGNFEKNFKKKFYDEYFATPIYPWKNSLVKEVEYQANTIKKLKDLLKKSHNNDGEDY